MNVKNLSTQNLIDAAKRVRETYVWQKDALSRGRMSEQKQELIALIDTEIAAIDLLLAKNGDFFEYLGGALSKVVNEVEAAYDHEKLEQDARDERMAMLSGDARDVDARLEERWGHRDASSGIFEGYGEYDDDREAIGRERSF